MDKLSRMLPGGGILPTRHPAEVDAWAEGLLIGSEKVAVEGAVLDDMPIRVPFGNSPNTLVNRYVKFTASDGRRPFYGYWQPALNTPAPLLINLPGYGGSITMHPQIADLGYHILHVSPLGYVTPEKTRDELALPDGNWPVLPNTAAGIPAATGTGFPTACWPSAGPRPAGGSATAPVSVRHQSGGRGLTAPGVYPRA